MQRTTSICSRITWFAISAIIFAATWQIGLRTLPAIARVFADFGIKPPIATQAVFTFGPAALVTTGLVASVFMVLGEFAPELRWLRAPLILLVLFLIAASLATAMPPIEMSCPP